MKRITGLVIILVVLFLGSYYGVGFITERTVKNNLNIVNQSNGVYAEVVNYNRGWFESHALLNWNVHVPARVIKSANGQTETIPAQDYPLAMPLTIYHGPVIFSDRGMKFGLGYAHAKLNLPTKVVKQFTSTFTKESTQPEMDITLLVNYLNHSQIKVTVPQFNLIAKQGNLTFDWMGMTSAVNTTASLSEIDGQFAVDGVRFAQDKLVATFGKVSGNYHLHKTDSGLFYGDANTVFPSVLIKNNDERMFELDELVVDSATDIKDNLFRADFKTSMDKLYVNGRNFGPGQLAIAIENLDANVLANINAQVNKAQQGTDVERQQAMLAILPELPKLFAAGPIFEISKMNLVVPQGTIEGDLRIMLPKNANLTNPFDLVQKIDGHSTLKMPAALMKELVLQSVKQRLMSQALEQSQAQTDALAKNVNAAQPAASATVPASTAAAVAPVASDSTAVKSSVANEPTIANLNQQITEQTNQEISEMLKSGLLVQQGTDFTIEINLKQGQFSVNGKPFNPSMLKF